MGLAGRGREDSLRHLAGAAVHPAPEIDAFLVQHDGVHIADHVALGLRAQEQGWRAIARKGQARFHGDIGGVDRAIEQVEEAGVLFACAEVVFLLNPSAWLCGAGLAADFPRPGLPR